MMTVLPTLPTVGANSAYAANRAPLLPSPLIKLPAGSVTPRGWLRHQLECMAEGYCGRLSEISDFCQFEGSAWASPDGEGRFGWEELPYWLRGYVSLGYALDDPRIIAEARKWLDATLTSQDESGYFGPRDNLRKHDLWPNMIMLDALRTFHEVTGDDRVITFMLNYCRWLNSLPFERFLPESWQKLRAGDLLDTIHWLYNQTGEAWLVELARIVHERTSDWSGTVASWHGVNICQCFREPAQFYVQSGDRRYLQATIRNYDTVMRVYGQVPGGMFGADENARPGYTGPQQAAETCSMVEIMRSHEMLTRITGDTLWADRCEDVAFNSLPASMTPDLQGLHYLTAPNMVQLDQTSKAPFLQNEGNMLAYDPRLFRCCQHNVAMGWPYFCESLWAATLSDGLAAMLYAPCEVEAAAGGRTVRIVEETDYPFGETVSFTITPDQPAAFPLFLRIPGWCEGARVTLNGVVVEGNPQPGSWVQLSRTWQPGDVVELDLPMSVRVRRWETQKNACSVHRGPLAYSLKIAEDWRPYREEEKWSAYEVYPASPWNYGLVLDGVDPASSVQFSRDESPLADQPFAVDTAPVQMQVRARRIPQWAMVGGICGPLERSPVRSSEPEETVTLIPMGCARLRISMFPVIGDGPDAVQWEGATIIAGASHVHDSLGALNDEILPGNSNDHNVPRFTWWDHRGTAEWVQYSFARPRTMKACEVYWFDDQPIGGQCRVPKSWRVLYLAGDQWREVEGASGYGVLKDQLNRCEFQPIETTALRLEVQLQPNWSGGILEWRIEGPRPPR